MARSFAGSRPRRLLVVCGMVAAGIRLRPKASWKATVGIGKSIVVRECLGVLHTLDRQPVAQAQVAWRISPQ